MKRRMFLIGLSGAAAGLPLVARAQAPAGKIPTVGILWHAGNRQGEEPNFTALMEGFDKLGYVDGKNIRFVHRFPNEMPERFRSMAAELVAMNPDVLIGIGVTVAPYLKAATSTIPIIFTLVADPVANKLVESLAKPGGNTTGLMLFGAELGGLRLQFLRDAVPGLSRVGFLFNPNAQLIGSYLDEATASAAKLGLSLQPFPARTVEEIAPAFVTMAKAGMQGASITPEGVFFQGRAIMAKAALANRLPTIVWSRETFSAGAFMSYGPDLLDILRRTAIYVDKILNGTKPADLPVEQPTRFYLLINLKVARDLGISIPPDLLLRADEVIE
jgi:putative tryptophan/tyrosine transport system substrate-binding protein